MANDYQLRYLPLFFDDVNGVTSYKDNVIQKPVNLPALNQYSPIFLPARLIDILPIRAYNLSYIEN